jgi:hypothetical protein
LGSGINELNQVTQITKRDAVKDKRTIKDENRKAWGHKTVS